MACPESHLRLYDNVEAASLQPFVIWRPDGHQLAYMYWLEMAFPFGVPILGHYHRGAV